MTEFHNASPFDGDGEFLVVVNDEGHHSIWPAGLAVPNGWKTLYGPDMRAECLDYLASVWSGPQVSAPRVP